MQSVGIIGPRRVSRCSANTSYAVDPQPRSSYKNIAILRKTGDIAEDFALSTQPILRLGFDLCDSATPRQLTAAC